MSPCGDPRTLEKRRLDAIKLLNESLGPGEIARRLCVNRRSVHRWLAAYRDRGIARIAFLPVPGRPCKLSLHDRERLARMLPIYGRDRSLGQRIRPGCILQQKI
jgi:transposase